MPPKPSELTDMSDIRAEIDRVDQALLDLIAERLELSHAVRRAKGGARLWRPAREHSLIRHLADAAGETPPELVSRIWAELVSAGLALQGPMRLHIALEGDAETVKTLVRDRFGAAIPKKFYPTASAALAGAYADEEGVAVMPSPGGLHNWWRALCADGAMPDMHILAALPRVGTDDRPQAVAVATADMMPAGQDDIVLVAVPSDADMIGLPEHAVWADSGDVRLLGFSGHFDGIKASVASLPGASVMGIISPPLKGRM